MPAYVNYLGQEIGLIDHGTKPRPKREAEPFHKGWQVVGVSPIALADARDENQKNAEWDEAAWIRAANLEPVARPYQLRSSAAECAELARKAGWLRVDIVEKKRGEAPNRPARSALWGGA